MLNLCTVSTMVAITVLAVVRMVQTTNNWSDCYTPYLISTSIHHISIAYKYNSILLLSVRAKTRFNHKTCMSFVEPTTNEIQVVPSKKSASSDRCLSKDTNTNIIITDKQLKFNRRLDRAFHKAFSWTLTLWIYFPFSLFYSKWYLICGKKYKQSLYTFPQKRP